jgi:type II secretory pathway predicted ATPase ExeA
MYEAFFELSGRPFPSTPDVGAYFPASTHEDALTLLKCGMNDGESVAALIGGPGSGKTLVCHLLIDALDPAQTLVFLNNIHDQSVESLIKGILHDLSLPFEKADESELRLRLVDFLMDRFSQGGKTILFIDEAQNLSPSQLEELRLLSNVEGRTDKAVQIILAGQKRLEETLADDRMASLCQRIAVTARLRPLTDDETMEYVRSQITRIGGSADSIFTASALSEICEYAAGIPRRINQICHRALTLAFAHQCGTLDAEYIHMAASQMFLLKPATELDRHHYAGPSASKRLFDDRAFRQLDRADDRSASAPTTSTVVEIGSEDDWSLRSALPVDETTAEGSYEVGSSWRSHSADDSLPRRKGAEAPSSPASRAPKNR